MEIKKIELAISPKKALESRFRFLNNLSIQGGWGYTKEDAVVISKPSWFNKKKDQLEGIALEYEFIKYRNLLEAYEGEGNNDVTYKLIMQRLVRDGKNIYDCLEVEVTCTRYENYVKYKTGIETDLQVFSYKREGWFEISSFYMKPKCGMLSKILYSITGK